MPFHSQLTGIFKSACVRIFNMGACPVDISNPGYEHLIPVIGPQIRMFMEAKPYVDLNPINFILTPEERLIYVDYQPLSDPEGAARNFSAWINYLNAWGY